MNNPQAILVMGLPASGKSSITKQWADLGYEVLNRDTNGGKVIDLLPKFKAALAAERPVILDNLFLTIEARAPFVQAAQEAGVPLTCFWMQTSLEDAQVNALNRMWDRYGTIFMTAADIKAHPQASQDPNMFPPSVLFAYRKKLKGDKKKGIPPGKPTLEEGFAKIEKVKFVRRPYEGTKKAVIVDYDGTLRGGKDLHGGEQHYPVKIEEVVALPNRKEVLQEWKDKGYMLLGISNQSGIAKGHLTHDMATACIEETNRQVGHDIEAYFCPHRVPPVSCFCRKPQSGLGVMLIRKHNLDPARCIYVGDLKTDETFAKRVGFHFIHADDFFKGA